MPTAAECAWEQLCQVVQGSCTEEQLVLLPLNDLRDLMAQQGFTPLTAARAEVQWQVLQTTNPTARRREYEESIKGSPHRSHHAGSPSIQPHSSAPHSADQPPPADPASSATGANLSNTSMSADCTPLPPSVMKAKRTASPRRANSPRRELGSKEGVPSPKSLRPPHTPSPSRGFGPVTHDKEFEVPRLLRGPHMSRRRNLSPRSALSSDDSPMRSSIRSPRHIHAPAAGCDPNEVGSKVGPRTTGLRPGSPAAAARSDPNSTSYDKQDPTMPSIRRIGDPNASHDPFGPPIEVVFNKTRTLPADRIPAVGNPNDVLPQPVAYRGKALIHMEGPSSCNPNVTNAATERDFMERKRRLDKGATTEEVVPRFFPTPGPAEAGVLPGSHSWVHGSNKEVVTRRQMVPTHGVALSNPNEVVPLNLKFIGGKAQIRGPVEQGAGAVLVGRGEAPPTKPAYGNGAGVNPNSLSPEAPSRRTGVGAVQGLPGTWGGPAPSAAARDTESKARASRRGASVGAYHPRGCADYSNACYSHRKAEHLVTGCAFTSSPRSRKGDFTPRFVPGST